MLNGLETSIIGKGGMGSLTTEVAIMARNVLVPRQFLHNAQC